MRSLTFKSHGSGIHIPIANLPKADISLRPELLTLLPYANIEAEHLITLDDLPGGAERKSDLPPDLTRWILVDHNSLAGELGDSYRSRVVGAIDHHVDEGKVPKDTGDEPRVIKFSGSCASLVTEYLRGPWEGLSLSTSSSAAAHAQGDSLLDDLAVTSLWDAQVAQLALGAILIDTTNLNDQNKTTDHDKHAVEYLEAKINACPRVSKDFDRANLYKTVDEAKRDLDSISLYDVLRKDYKQWKDNGMELGISSVVKPISWLKGKADKGTGLVGALVVFAEERSLNIHAVMTTYSTEDGDFARDLMVLTRDEHAESIVETFVRSSAEELALQDVDEGGEHGISYRIWRQGNVAASRKQVAPMLRKAMTGCCRQGEPC